MRVKTLFRLLSLAGILCGFLTQAEAQTYCTPVYSIGSAGGDFINAVQLGSINNVNSGAGASPFYTDYSATQSTSLLPGGTYTVSVQVGFFSGSNHVACWIDYNADGTFATAERIGQSTTSIASNGTQSFTFTVPATATAGTTRMRVREVFSNTNIDPCNSYQYGEAEDYGIVIQPTPPTDVAFGAFITPTVNTNGCVTNSAATVTITNSGSAAIDLSTTPIAVTVTTGTQSISTSVTPAVAGLTSFAVGASLTVNVGILNLTAGGTYTLTGTATCTGDGFAGNNTGTKTITPTAPTALPIAVNFSGWTGGTVSTPWTGATEGSGSPLPTGTTSNWTSDDYINSTTNANGTSVRLRLTTSNARRDWMISPKILATSATTLTYDLALTTGNGTAATTLSTGDTLALRVSTDCGATWTNLSVFTSSATISNTGQLETVNLSAYAGQEIYVAWYGSEGTATGGANVDIFVDNINFKNVFSTDISLLSFAKIPAGNCPTAAETLKVAIKNIGSNAIDLTATPIGVSVAATGANPGTYSATVSTTTSGGTSFAAGDTVYATLTTSYDMTAGGTHTFDGLITVTGDGNAANDTLSTSVAVTAAQALPILVNFVGYTGTNLPTAFPGWREANGVSMPTGTTSNWTSINYINTVGTPNDSAARINLWTNTTRSWLISPKFTPLAGTELTYDIALTDFLATTAATLGSDDSVVVRITTNCGLSWTNLKVYRSTSTISNTGQNDVINLSAYAGQEVQVAWYATDGNAINTADVDVFIDNINILQLPAIDIAFGAFIAPNALPNGCLNSDMAVVTLINKGSAAIDLTTTPISVSAAATNSGNTQTLTLTVNAANAGQATLPVGDTLTVTVGTFTMTAGGTYALVGTATCAGDGKASNDTGAGTVSISALSALPIAANFTGYSSNVATLPTGWNEGKGVSKPITLGGSNWQNDSYGNVTGGPNGTSARIQLNSNSDSEWLITPQFPVTANTVLAYDIAMTVNTLTTTGTLGSDDTVAVRISTDCGITWANLVTYTAATAISNTGQRDSMSLSAYAGQNAYIAWYGSEGTVNDAADMDIFIDNVNIKNIVAIDLAFNSFSSPTVTAGGCVKSDSVKVSITNQGTSAINLATTSVVVAATANNGGNIQTISNTLTAANTGVSSIAAGATLTVPVGIFSLANAGTYSLKGSVTCAGDAIATNDSGTTSVTIIAPTALPIVVDFANYTGANLATAYTGWSEANGATPTGTTSLWENLTFGNVTGSTNGTAAVVNLYSNIVKAWFISSKFIPTVNASLTYDIALTDFNITTATTLGSDDTVEVRISTNCGATWTALKTYTAASIVSNTGQNETINLAAYAGQEVIVGWYASAGSVNDVNDVDVFIDNINITQPPTIDIALTAFAPLPASGCPTAAETIQVQIVNTGLNAIDLSVTPIEVLVDVTGAVSAIFADTLHTTPTGVSFAAGDTIYSTLTTAFSMTKSGTYTFDGLVTLVGDLVASNDTLSVSAQVDSTYATPLPSVNFANYTGGNLTTLFSGWREASGVIPAGTTSAWTSDTYGNATGGVNGTSARLQLNNATDREWIISPRFIPSALTSLTYDIALTQNTATTAAMLGSDDSVAVYISTDCGNSWNILKLYTAASALSNTGKRELMSLTAYAGQTVIIGFYGTEGVVNDPDNVDVFLDNINIYTLPPVDAAIINLSPLPAAGCPSATETITMGVYNAGANAIDLSLTPLYVSMDVTGVNPATFLDTITTTATSTTFAPGDTVYVTFSTSYDMTAAGSYTFNGEVLVLNDADTTNNVVASTATTAAVLAAPLPIVTFTGYTGGNLATVFTGWRETKGTGKPSATGTASNWTDDSFGNVTTSPNGRAARLRLNNDTDREWMVSPHFTVTAATAVSYDMALTQATITTAGNLGSDDSVAVAISTDCGTSWTYIKTYTATSSISNTGQNTVLPLGAYAGQTVILGFYATEGTTDDPQDVDIFFDNINVYLLPNEDVQMVGFNNVLPAAGCPSATETVSVAISNTGALPIDLSTSPIFVSVDITGPNATTLLDTLHTTGSGTIFAVGDTIFATLTTSYNMTAGGTYAFTATSTTANDGNISNDTSATLTVQVANIVATPIVVNFTGYTGANLGTLFTDWREATGANAPAGTTSAWVSDDFGNVTGGANGISARINLWDTGKNEWMISPKFVVPATNPVVTYDFAMAQYNTTTADTLGSDDVVKLLISTDCGATWTTLKTYDATSTISNTGQNESVSLTAYAGQTAILAWFGSEGTVDDVEDNDIFVDNINIKSIFNNDISATAVLSPIGGCGVAADSIKVVVCNVGTQAQSNFPVNVTFTGGGNNTFNYAGTLAAGACDTVILGTVNTLAGGTFAFTAFTALSGDADTSNDTTLYSINVTAPSPTPTVTGTLNLCVGDSTTLTATGVQNAIWMDASMTKISQGLTFTTPALTANTTYFVQGATGVSEFVGPASPSAVGASSNLTTYLQAMYFDVTAPITLDSVTVYPNGAGNVVVELQDANLVTITSTTVAVNPASANAAVRIPVGFSIPVGSYALAATGTTTGGLLRNTAGASYPYTSPSGAVSITDNTFDPTYYYFFYNWKVSTAGCTSNAQAVNVSVNGTLSLSLGKDTTLNCANSTITLDATTAGAVSYLWNGGATTPTLAVTAAGTYSVTATNATGCTSSDTIVVTLPAALNATTTTKAATCSGQSNGAAYAVATGGTGAYSYSWNTGVANDTLANVGGGIYTVTVTDSKGCTATASATVGGGTSPVVTLPATTSGCGSAALDAGNANTGASYVWSNGGTPAGTTQFLTATQSGSYQVIVTNSFGCADTGITVVTIDTLPVVNLGGNKTICSPTVLDAGNAGSTYLWSNSATTQTITAASSGAFSVTVTNSKGCQGTGSVTLTFVAAPVAPFAKADTTACGSVTLDAKNTGMTYLWNNGSAGKTLLATQTGSYSVKITNGAGCSVSDTITVNLNIAPTAKFTVDATGFPVYVFQNTTATLPGTTYNWEIKSSGGGASIATATTQDLTFDFGTVASGFYDITLTATNICGQDTFTYVLGYDNIADALGQYISVYPNPTEGAFVVNITNLTGSMNLTLFDVSGKEISREHLTVNGDMAHPMTLEGVAKGIYTLRIQTAQGVTHKRIILQ